MNQALALDSRMFALELHELLRDLDPSRWDGVETAARARIAALEARLASVIADVREPVVEQAAILERLDGIAVLLRDSVPPPDLPKTARGSAWKRYRKQLGTSYEALVIALKRRSVELPSLRPTNYVRSGWHVLVAITLIVLVEQVLSTRQLWLVPVSVAASFWVCEALRHLSPRARAFFLWIFSPIAHPHERYHINSSTWFGTALAIIGLAYSSVGSNPDTGPMVCALAIAVIGLADPAAAMVGRRWGRIRLGSNRSLEGSLAFTLVGLGACFAVLSMWHGDIGLGARVALCLAATLPAAIIELLSRRIDDNLTIPIAAATGAWIGTLLVG